MKSAKNWRLILLLFLAIVTVQSCEKDPDDIIAATSATDTDTKGTDTKDETPDSSTNTDSGNTDGDNSGTDTSADFDEGSITLYTVEGNNLVKQKDFNVSGKELELQKDLKSTKKFGSLPRKSSPQVTVIK